MLTTSDNPYGGAWGVHAGNGIVGVDVLVSDFGQPGAQIAFTRDGADAQQLLRRLAVLNRKADSPFAGLPVERRGNVVLFQLTGDTEILRIIYGCTGGKPYHGDGGPPPELGPTPSSRREWTRLNCASRAAAVSHRFASGKEKLTRVVSAV